MLAASRALAAPSITFGNDPRAARLAQEHSKLSQSLFNYVSTNLRMVALGPDPLVAQLAAAKGFTKFDLVMLRTAIGRVVVTLIAVPTRLWRDEESRHIILRLKAEAAMLGTKCVLIPQKCIRGTTRAQVARTLSMSRNVRIQRTHAETVLHRVKKERIVSLIECASLVSDHDDPVGVILALCARGDLLIDRSQPICPSSWVTYRPSDSSVEQR